MSLYFFIAICYIVVSDSSAAEALLWPVTLVKMLHEFYKKNNG